MKVLFTADIHIKLGQKNVPVDWAKARYDKLFREICNICASEKIDILVLGGDIFDKLPNMAELELYFDFIMRIRCETIIISGNHEADKKNTTFLSNLKDITYQISCATGEHRIHILDNYASMYGMDFIPYNKLKDFASGERVNFTNPILVTHVRGDIPPHVKAEVPLSVFEKWHTVLAGDLHSYSNSQLNILYPGSPITTSFHRNLVDTGVIIFDTERLEHEWRVLDMPQLIRKTIKAGEPMPQTDYHHTIYEVEGDMSELSGLENSALLDKKVVKRDTDTTLILSPEMTIAHEVEEYLRYVLGLNDEAVSDVLKELNGVTINE